MQSISLSEVAYPSSSSGSDVRYEMNQMLRELTGAAHAADSRNDFLRYAADVLLSRARIASGLGRSGPDRTISICDGVRITYRLERGDVWALQEVWWNKVYSLPPGYDEVRVFVDVGAHIGLTSVWFAKKYSPSHVIAVEPFGDNLRLLRINLEENDVAADVVEGAIADRNGIGCFHVPSHSASGRIGPEGREVSIMTMGTLLDRIPGNKDVDVLKIDVEGGEREIFSGDVSWLTRVRMIMLEFHPWVAPAPLVSVLAQYGFGEIGRTDDHTRCFVR